MEIGKDKAKALIKIARAAIAGKKKTPEVELGELLKRKKLGVFVTLFTYPERALRGCIGYAEPVFPLAEGVKRAAVHAAYSDIRFKPMSKEELEKTIIEISILTEPELVKADRPLERLKKIKPGDGLILKFGTRSGILLPQVWDQIHNKESFLNALCAKAGLPPAAWLDPRAELRKFKVRIFAEIAPGGEIKEITAPSSSP